MGRDIPAYHDYNNYNHNDHPILSLAFVIACIAATIAVVSSLCGALSRKKPPGAPVGEDETSPRNQEKLASSPPKAESTAVTTTPQPPPAEAEGSTKKEGSRRGSRRDGDVARPLPPPPSRSTSCHVRSHSTPMSPQGGKLESSMSMRVSTGSAALSMRQGSRRAENGGGKIKYLKHEDSIWKKAIILGEKCRVPDEDEEAIVYDEKGNRISTYHPKTKSNAFEIMSRQNSSAEPPEKSIHNA